MKVVVTSPSFSNNKVLQEDIHRHFPNAKLNLEGKRFSKDELISYIGDADAIIVGLEDIDDDLLESCPNLKIISKYGVGLNNIDLDACQKRGIQIGWTGGVNRLSVAEMTLGYMLMLCRNLYITSNELKQGVWNKSGGFQLSGKTVGIIGVGHIGKELIRLLKPFGCRILVNDIIAQPDFYRENNLIETTKEELYTQSDIITIHTPLDDTTNKMINSDVFQQMKSGAFILNSARGGIIDENDLKHALQNRMIAGAAIDAYIEEPPTDTELLRLPNLICTPHIGGNAVEAVEAMGLSAIHYLREYFNV
jgi:phosphoglycerate dehydrogenase-like enzyme